MAKKPESKPDAKAQQDDALRDAGIVLPEDPRPAAQKTAHVYSVEIPRCLLGVKYILAASEEEALEKYKASCGITRHTEPAKVRVTDLDPNNLPEGVALYGS